MGRKILFVTTDQQRFDALGCNGGTIARTPRIDALAAQGLNYQRAHNQNVVCMPARATLLTGQLVRTHGVISNGIPVPEDAPNVARTLKAAGYKTALIGKAHFDPAADPDQSFFENWAARENSYGPHRGFDHMELAGHTGRAGRSLFHYPKWLVDNHPDEVNGYYATVDSQGSVNGTGGGETGAIQVAVNPIPKAHYHTDWVAERAVTWLNGVDADADWFLWLSFPDPHHPWDPPASEVSRVPWRELDLPPGYPGSAQKSADILRSKPRHWLEWFEGRNRFAFETPPSFRPCDVTPDQIREINALTHVENELIDEALGQVLDTIGARGWDGDTDIIFTTDHGEFQGDFGLLFKGPHHVDALMRVPLIWRPAPNHAVPPAVIDTPVGHLDIAPTLCQIANTPAPAAMDGSPLPTQPSTSRERVYTEWDGEFGGNGVYLRSMCNGRYVCTVYEASNFYDGSEGELYDLVEDPLQWRNLWDDPDYTTLRKTLTEELREHLPPARTPALVAVAPV
jgi:arylsulfatase A-like enzyme